MKNYLLPILIIFIAGLLGANIFLNQKLSQQIADTNITNKQNLRLLAFKAPGMFCLGCSASMEGYLSQMGGVHSVNASLATKKVEVVYDASVVTKEAILGNQILDAYGKELLSDEAFIGDSQVKTPSTTNLPQSLVFKFQEAAAKVTSLEDQDTYQALFDEIDEVIGDGDYEQAESMLDKLLVDLQQGR